MNLALFPFLAELKAFLGDTSQTENQVEGYRVFAAEIWPRWKFALCGQGKVEAALACGALAKALSVESVLLLGAATAISPLLKLGDVVVASECVEIDFKPGGENGVQLPPRFRSRLNPMPNLIPKWSDTTIHIGKILSADADLFDPTEKKSLGETHSALAFAWEGAGFHRALRRLGIPGLEARVITETVNETRLEREAFQGRVAAYLGQLRPLASEWDAFSSTAPKR